MRALIFALAALAALEVLVRIYQARRRHIRFLSPYRSPGPKALAFESHPYALYVKACNVEGLYPSNNLGYAGKRSVAAKKVAGVVRIYCAGGSTTEQHDPELGPDSSWPAILQDVLTLRFPGTKVECINAGAAGYTSAESLVEFLVRGLDLQPDILLVYHNVNDAWTCQMVDGFKSDYSHARRHKPWSVGWVNRIPNVPYLRSYEVLRDRVTQRYGKAQSLLHWVSDPPWTTVRHPNADAVAAFKRNIRSMAALARTWSCVPVLIKWECDWSAESLPPLLADDAETRKTFLAYLHANNQSLHEVAHDVDGCRYLDVGPFDASHFAAHDRIHFSASGLREMAERVAGGIESLVRSIVERHAPAPVL